MGRPPEWKVCQIPGCENEYLCKGYCSMHYQRWKKHGDPLICLTGPKQELCTKCGVSPHTDNHSWCRPCLNESSREWNASEKGPRWRRYKLTKSDVQVMKDSQNNSCMICGDSFEVVADHVDHDNRCCPKEKVNNGGTCGECIRDLLCGSCNQGLGNFKDDVDRLLAAVAYLEKWNQRDFNRKVG